MKKIPFPTMQELNSFQDPNLPILMNQGNSSIHRLRKTYLQCLPQSVTSFHASPPHPSAPRLQYDNTAPRKDSVWNLVKDIHQHQRAEMRVTVIQAFHQYRQLILQIQQTLNRSLKDRLMVEANTILKMMDLKDKIYMLFNEDCMEAVVANVDYHAFSFHVINYLNVHFNAELSYAEWEAFMNIEIKQKRDCL